VKAKVKAKKKPGRVIRIDPLLVKTLEEKKRPYETMSGLLRRLMGLPSRKGAVEVRAYYVLPSDMAETVEEARGRAIIEKVKRKLAKPERPVVVREVV